MKKSIKAKDIDSIRSKDFDILQKYQSQLLELSKKLKLKNVKKLDLKEFVFNTCKIDNSGQVFKILMKLKWVSLKSLKLIY